MREILEGLRAQPGILGCLVTTPDGIVVWSELGEALDEDVAAALVSSLLVGTEGLLAQCGRLEMKQLTLRATRGKIVVTHLGNACLVTVMEGELDLEQTMVEVRSAAAQLRKIGRIAV